MTVERILVTGGAGLIGRAVVEELAELGAHVVVFDLGERPSDSDAVDEWITGSITDSHAVGRAVEGADRVIHLAGLPGLEHGNAREIYEANALGTFIVLDAAASAGARSIVYASSINANGLPLNPHGVWPRQYPWDEDEPADIADPYSLSKQADEAAALAIHRRYGVQVIGLRYPLVRDITVEDGAVFARHIREAVRRDSRRQAVEGWTYLDVRDAARATALALTADASAAIAILLAAPNTYLREPTESALQRFAPHIPRGSIEDRAVPVSLQRAQELLGFRASVQLEDIGENLLIEAEEALA